MKNQEFISLCIKDITGNIEKLERDKLVSWLNQSPANKVEYEKIKKIWDGTATDTLSEYPDIEEEWATISEKLNLSSSDGITTESVFEKVKTFFSFVFMPKLKPISAVALFIVFVLVGLYMFNSIPPEYKIREISTPNAATQKVTLPDGSLITLNSGSNIKYSDPFKDDFRLVELEGEAFFSVNKSKIPFVIKTNNAQIKVLGTEFNVWSRETKTKVIVKNGKVELASKLLDNEKVTLTKNELSLVTKNEAPLEPEKVDSEYLIGWLNSELVFDQNILSEIADELERHYDITINIQDDELKELSLTGSFKNEDPDSVLTMICTALDLGYSKEGNNYRIISKQ